MNSPFSRRSFLTESAAAAVLATVGSTASAAFFRSAAKFEISIAEWSLHRALFEKKVDHLDFSRIAKEEFGISAVEYVNQFLRTKHRTKLI